MTTFRDQLGRTLSLINTPKRIVCLVPSITEMLVDLGLEAFIVGVTKFCEHPTHIRKQKTVVGGTKQVHFNKIKELKPDFIICNKEENTQAMVLELETIAPVWVSDIYTLEDSLEMIKQLGTVLGVSAKAKSLVKAIEIAYSDYKQSPNNTNLKVGYLIWKDPYMAVGSNTFINSMLEIIGLHNVFAKSQSRYPEVSPEAFKQLDVLLLSSEPFPFKKEHQHALAKITPANVCLVDGTYFSWYGSRLEHSFKYFKTLGL